MSSLKQYLVPVTLEHFDSDFNKDIDVVTFLGKIRLDMGGLTQSGDIIENIWARALKKHIPSDLKPTNILLLGVGGGSAAKYLHHRWPQANIIGVEIDPEVIRIAKQYFSADNIHNFSIINDDAINFVSNINGNYDIVMVDCYQGDQIPKELEDLQLLDKLKSHCKYLLLNRLFWDDYQKHTLAFIKNLKTKFDVSTCRTPSNLVLSIQDGRV